MGKGGLKLNSKDPIMNILGKQKNGSKAVLHEKKLDLLPGKEVVDLSPVWYSRMVTVKDLKK